MAQRVLTDEERIQLRQYSRFQSLVDAAIWDKSNYWKGLDGSSVPGNDWIKWAKSRFLAHSNLRAPANIDFPSWLGQFSALMTNQTVQDDQVAFDMDAVVDYMNTNNIFDAVMDQVFDLRIADIPF